MVFKVIIPTLNPGPNARLLAETIRAQRSQPSDVLIVDSGSVDFTSSYFREVGFTTHSIETAQFDHGGTRNLGVALAAPAEIVVLLTQDVVLADEDAFSNLLATFSDERVALVCGRQLPRTGAGPIEAHARAYNYPDVHNSRSLDDCRTLGFKAVFNSNAFAAYRVRALEEVGGFPIRTIMGEDQIVAARLLLAGWKVSYNGRAAVKHSHGYSLAQEFRRYFDIGVFHRAHRDLLAPFGTATKEGGRFLRSELSYLARTYPHRVPEALLRTTLKLFAYRAGRRYDALPRTLNRRLAMNPGYFDVEEGWDEKLSV